MKQHRAVLSDDFLDETQRCRSRRNLVFQECLLEDEKIADADEAAASANLRSV
jgi:hypothetical protein